MGRKVYRLFHGTGTAQDGVVEGKIFFFTQSMLSMLTEDNYPPDIFARSIGDLSI